MNRSIEYKGFVAVQDDKSLHLQIFKDGKMVLHVTCTEELTDKEIRDYIDLNECLEAASAERKSNEKSQRAGVKKANNSKDSEHAVRERLGEMIELWKDFDDPYTV